MSDRPLVISCGNQKGGVGKTTTTVNLAYALGEAGYRVLVVDGDPQGNTTSILLKEIALRERFSLVKALETMADGGTLTENACNTSSDNVRVVPNTVKCILWERSVANTSDSVLAFMRLIRNDKELKEYDFLVIDTPPNVGTMVNNALLISDYVIIPIPTSDQFALDGLAVYLKLLQSFRSQNNKLKLLGMVFTKFDTNCSLHLSNREKIVKFFTAKGINVFNTAIRFNVEIDKSHMKRKTILEFNPESYSAADYRSLCKEIIELINYDSGKQRYQ